MTVTSSPGNLHDVVARRRAEATGDIVRTLGRVGELGVRAATVLAPRGPTGNYVERLDATTRSSPYALSTTIGGRAPHSHLVERGRKPGKMPPAEKMAAILKIPRSEAFVIARAIGRSGTTGSRVLARTADVIRPQVRQLAAQLAARIGSLR